MDQSSGLRVVKPAHPEFWSPQHVFVVYGTATIVLPFKMAYEAAGLAVPPELQKEVGPEGPGPPQAQPKK